MLVLNKVQSFLREIENRFKSAFKKMVCGTFKDKIISILTKCVQMTTLAAL